MVLQQSNPIIDLLAPAAHGKLALRLGLINNWYAIESAGFSSLFGDSPNRQPGKPLASYDQIILFSFSRILEKNIEAVASAEIHRIAPRPEPGERAHVAQHLLEGMANCGLIEVPSIRLKNYFWDRPVESPLLPPGHSYLLVHPGSGIRYS